MVAPSCWIPGLLFVFDFQGSSFNLANSVNPIILANDQVNFIPVNAAETEFILRFPLPEPVDVSWPTNNPASPIQFSQAFAQPGGGIFELVCAGTSSASRRNPIPNSASIIEVGTGLALTAWETQPGSPFSPVSLLVSPYQVAKLTVAFGKLTYEIFTGRVEQVFEFVEV
ncbi:hypothetical protein B0H19DRAFT_1073567 [Mycena capillaripes]|nr:hypothetical protein B0H19DRAFT_1073567 [Mycena capillaripes]